MKKKTPSARQLVRQDGGGQPYSLFHMTLHSFIGPVTLIGVVVFRQDAPYG